MFPRRCYEIQTGEGIIAKNEPDHLLFGSPIARAVIVLPGTTNKRPRAHFGSVRAITFIGPAFVDFSRAKIFPTHPRVRFVYFIPIHAHTGGPGCTHVVERSTAVCEMKQRGSRVQTARGAAR